MILNPKFVFLLMPRTGSTFCEDVLMARAHGSQRYFDHPSERTKHNWHTDIPAEYQGLPIFGVRRDPLDLWASWYMDMWQNVTRESFEAYYAEIVRLYEQFGVTKPNGKGFMATYYSLMFPSEAEFLDFADLNGEMCRLLERFDYPSKGVKDWPAKNIGDKRRGKHWSEIIPPHITEEIRRTEAWN